MNETEFKSMVKSIRDAESAIGNVDYNLTSKQKKVEIILDLCMF